MRLQLALNVKDLETAISYYGRLLGVDVNKREPGYANFVIQNPALKLVLFETPDADERLNHVGFEVFDDQQVDAAAGRLRKAGLEVTEEQAEVCCYARQNKAITYDPQGLMWEWYRVLEDSPTFFAESSEACCAVAESGSDAAGGCCAS